MTDVWLQRCEIKKTFSFVEFERIEDAKEACEQLHGSRINGREITGALGSGGRGRAAGRQRGAAAAAVARQRCAVARHSRSSPGTPWASLCCSIAPTLTPHACSSAPPPRLQPPQSSTS